MSSFAGIESTPTIEQAFARDGIKEPTLVQSLAIEPILRGDPVVVSSGTGTGKTLAYLLPILERLRTNPEGRAVIMTPSAELSVQVANIARRYKAPEVSVAVVVSGGNPKREQLQKSTRLVIGTAGRILDLYSQRKLKGVTTVVLDEPDPILVADVPNYLTEILLRPEPKVQLVVCGATMGAKTQTLIERVMGERAVHVKSQDEPVQTRISHHFLRVDPQARDVALARFLKTLKGAQAIVFASQEQRFRHLYRYLGEQGFKPATVSGERTKQQRREALDAFAAGNAKVLLVSDVAGRGIDIKAVDWVVHYEPATSAAAYVHRAGRTGRAGRSGTSVALVTDPELAVLQKFARELGIDCSPLDAR